MTVSTALALKDFLPTLSLRIELVRIHWRLEGIEVTSQGIKLLMTISFYAGRVWQLFITECVCEEVEQADILRMRRVTHQVAYRTMLYMASSIKVLSIFNTN